MRISKLLSAVCVAAFCASFVAARAQDTPAQAAARAALMKKMGELNQQPAQPAPAQPVQSAQPPAISVTTTNAAVVQPATPATEAAPPMTTPSVATPPPAETEAMGFESTGDTPAQAAARAALAEKMQQMEGQPVSPTQPASHQWRTTNPATASKPATTTMATKPFAMPPAKPERMFSAGNEPGFAPIQAPPPPVSAAKDARLHALLESYVANQITPEQYQAQRAKILAEP